MMCDKMTKQIVSYKCRFNTYHLLLLLLWEKKKQKLTCQLSDFGKIPSCIHWITLATNSALLSSSVIWPSKAGLVKRMLTVNPGLSSLLTVNMAFSTNKFKLLPSGCSYSSLNLWNTVFSIAWDSRDEWGTEGRKVGPSYVYCYGSVLISI